MDGAPTTAASTPTGAFAAAAGPPGLLLLRPATEADSICPETGRGRTPIAGCGASDSVSPRQCVQPPGLDPQAACLQSSLFTTSMPVAATTAAAATAGVAFGSAGLEAQGGAQNHSVRMAAEAEVAAAEAAGGEEAVAFVWREDIVPAGLRDRRLFNHSFAAELHLVAPGRPAGASYGAVTAPPCDASADEADSEEGLLDPPEGPARIPMAAGALP
jgi:hypothetical protein